MFLFFFSPWGALLQLIIFLLIISVFKGRKKISAYLNLQTLAPSFVVELVRNCSNLLKNLCHDLLSTAVVGVLLRTMASAANKMEYEFLC